ncbi:hypothetical protein Y1Q_0014483 [Alligator mississippiensis]|uniref:Uncharacterized protein n=1 Tax=Alligator mississippiensis TaxID=8496 RepID=A0A151PD23_ALLMI|nr:hypothetical protein Y1Q_0014483 [Alligator mississippiensis]
MMAIATCFRGVRNGCMLMSWHMMWGASWVMMFMRVAHYTQKVWIHCSPSQVPRTILLLLVGVGTVLEHPGIHGIPSGLILTSYVKVGGSVQDARQVQSTVGAPTQDIWLLAQGHEEVRHDN